MNPALVDVLCTAHFSPDEVRRRLGAVVDAASPAPAAVAALREVTEAVRAGTPERRRDAAELYVAEIYWHGLLQQSDRFMPELHPLADHHAAGSGFSKRCGLIDADGGDFFWVMRVFSASVPATNLPERARRLAAIAQDLVRTLDGDAEARARLRELVPPAPALADATGNIWSEPPIDERVYDLVVRFDDVAAELRFLIDHLARHNSVGLASTGARVIARRAGLQGIAPGVTVTAGTRIDEATVTHEAARPLIQIAQRIAPALACELVEKIAASGWLAKDRALWMCDDLAWDDAFEVRGAGEWVRARRLGGLVLVWSGKPGAGGRLRAKVEKTAAAAKKALDKALTAAEQKLAQPRTPPAPLADASTLEAEFRGAPDRMRLSELLRAAGPKLAPTVATAQTWTWMVRDPEVVRMALAAGIVPEEGLAEPLRMCADRGFWGVESGRLLLAAGAQVTRAALRQAAEVGNGPFLSLLMEHGRAVASEALPELRELAARNKHYAVMELLGRTP